ncbi:spore maturation protein A [Clostridia bacterium]|nr:spore maturation protein A [Clostridia bacterium]
MMKWVFAGLILLSVIIGCLLGTVERVGTAAISGGEDAIKLTLTIGGVICFWNGIMNVAREAGLTDVLAKAFMPLLRRIFKGLDPNGKALQYISLNLTANLLGLGNASTPFGISAMCELANEEHVNEIASNNMVYLVVMNTASLQILPATVAALRAKHGSVSPMEILVPIWVVSVINLTATLIMAKILTKWKYQSTLYL